MRLGCAHCTKSECDCPKSVQSATPITALRDPEAGIRRHASEVRMQILRKILDNEKWEQLVTLAIERSTSIGAQQYGDASYFKSDAELEFEGDCEIADWIFYEHVPLERE